jgi:hypothetical protein
LQKQIKKTLSKKGGFGAKVGKIGHTKTGLQAKVASFCVQKMDQFEKSVRLKS